jgi:hypothetical protein
LIVRPDRYRLRRRICTSKPTACLVELFDDVDGRCVEVWPHTEPGKLRRSDLDLLVAPRG